jgi:hypothetical protein
MATFGHPEGQRRCLDRCEVSKAVQDMNAAENAMVYANRHRGVRAKSMPLSFKPNPSSTPVISANRTNLANNAVKNLKED